MPISFIYIRDLEFDISVGDEPEEREAPQPICLELDLHADFSAVNKSDTLKDTVDYIAITNHLKEIALSKHYDMLEHLAFKLIESTFQTFKAITQIRLAVHKPKMDKAFGAKIGIEYGYSRSDFTSSP